MSKEMKEQAQGYIKKLKSWYQKEIDLISKKTGVDGKIISSILLVCSFFCFIDLDGFIAAVSAELLSLFKCVPAIRAGLADLAAF